MHSESQTSKSKIHWIHIQIIWKFPQKDWLKTQLNNIKFAWFVEPFPHSMPRSNASLKQLTILGKYMDLVAILDLIGTLRPTHLPIYLPSYLHLENTLQSDPRDLWDCTTVLHPSVDGLFINTSTYLIFVIFFPQARFVAQKKLQQNVHFLAPQSTM